MRLIDADALIEKIRSLWRMESERDNITLDMPLRMPSGAFLDVTAVDFVPMGSTLNGYRLGFLAGDKDSHSTTPPKHVHLALQRPIHIRLFFFRRFLDLHAQLPGKIKDVVLVEDVCLNAVIADPVNTVQHIIVTRLNGLVAPVALDHSSALHYLRKFRSRSAAAALCS